MEPRSTFEQIRNKADELAARMLDSVTEVSAAELNLDQRSFPFALAGPDYIAVRIEDRARCDYYAGFEYVDRDEIEVVGPWVFYGAGDERILAALECLQEGTDEEQQ